MNLYFSKDGVSYVENMLPKETCQTILSLYENDSRKQTGSVVCELGEKEVQEDIKVSTDLVIRDSDIWQEAYAQVNAAVKEALRRIVEEVEALQLWPLCWTGYKIQHYKKGEGQFKWHFDAIGPGTWARQMAMVIYLKTVEEGGETSFLRQGLKLKPLVGDGVFFPPFWTHAHCGEIPLSEDKFIISTFVSFDIPGAGASG
jgi:hypothetical protein